jgi:small subunit ribosomal protein S23
MPLPLVLPLSHGSSARDAHPPQSNKFHATVKSLTEEETLELIRRAVEDGIREKQRSLPGSEAVDDAVRPKLTIDLGYSNIDRIPESAVDIIKADVARLDYPLRIAHCTTGLRWVYFPCHYRRNNPADFTRLSFSNNHIDYIPSRFSECIHLRYLNIRSNNFTQFPKGVRS